MIPDKRPTRAVVRLDRLQNNLNALRRRLPAGREMLPVIKADGYGHGAIAVGRALLSRGITRLAVATFEEALQLRLGGIAPGEAEVFVLNGLMGPIEEYMRARFVPVLHQREELRAVADYHGGPLDVAVKFDTGMGRLGLMPPDAPVTASLLRKARHLSLRCVMTHLARADEGVEATLEPYRRFAEIRSVFRGEGFGDVPFSICNSASIIDSHFDDYEWVRPGIAMYGAYPHPRQRPLIDLHPVLELKTAVIELKRLPKGAGVGYGAAFTCPRESIIAMLPVGYADGYPRLISNRGCVLIRGRRAPIVGRISMDLMAVDATDIPGAAVYDEVVLIGSDGGETLRVEEVAGWAETISYEILTGLMPRVLREYPDHG